MGELRWRRGRIEGKCHGGLRWRCGRIEGRCGIIEVEMWEN